METINITATIQYNYVEGQYIDVDAFSNSIRFDVTDYPTLIPDLQDKANLERFVGVLVSNPYNAFSVYISTK